MVKTRFGVLISGILLATPQWVLGSQQLHADARKLGAFHALTLGGLPCPPRADGYGPYDYTNSSDRAKHLDIVEKFHFTAAVERLESGASSTDLTKDLAYTLMAFPNHHKALLSAIQWATTPGSRGEPRVPVIHPECYLQRALAFRPKDSVVYGLYGYYLHKIGRHDLAKVKYLEGLKIAPNSSELQYNYALLLVDLGQYEDAREHAQRAYQLGYPLPGLRRRLEAAGFPLRDSAQQTVTPGKP